MALILNIETATKECSIALAKDGEIVAIREQGGKYTHAELVAFFIDDIFTNSSYELKDLDAVAVSKGPGSYTGLRIGVSSAKGLCYSLGIPLIAIDTLRAMANGIFHSEEKFDLMCPMIDARRMEVYTAIFDHQNKMRGKVNAKIIDKESYTDLLENNKIAFFGDGSEKVKDVIQNPNAIFPNGGLCSAKWMISLSEKHFKEEVFVDTAYFEPYYLKDFVAGNPKVKGL